LHSDASPRKACLGIDTPLGKLRGSVHRFGLLNTPVVVTYHPAYLLRSPGEKRKAWEDLKFARTRLCRSAVPKPEARLLIPMATVPKELPLPQLAIRRMTEADVPAVVAAERAGYPFPWSEGIFRDCLRAGYLCRVAELDQVVCGLWRAQRRRRRGARAQPLRPSRVPLPRPRTADAATSHRHQPHCGCHDLFLEVRPSNLAAVRLYSRSSGPPARRS
jgi:ribosomal protein S18 acetylase RimI-like enzyme